MKEGGGYKEEGIECAMQNYTCQIQYVYNYNSVAVVSNDIIIIAYWTYCFAL